MPSDIFIKTGTTDSTWKKAKSIFINTAAGVPKTAKAVWLAFTAGNWTKVWPLSGIFSTSDPYITTSAGNTVHLGSSNVVQIGTTYVGKNGTWNPNGWTIQSYSYQWYAYNSASLLDMSGVTLETGTYSSPVTLDMSSTTYATKADRRYLSFAITANASNSAYNGYAESANTDGRIYIIRKVPLNISYSLNAGPYSEGNTISFSSAWNITEPYKIESSSVRTSLGLSPGTIKWYSVSSLTNIYAGGGRTEITRASGLYSWTIQTTDNLAGKYIIAEETVFNSGSDYLYGNNGFVNGANQVTIATSTTVQAAVAPGAFSISSVTKGFPVVGSQGAYRPVSISWGAATNATSYEYLIESSSDGVTWATATAPTSPFLPFSYANDSTTSTSVSSLSVNYAKYYRASVRAKSASNLYTSASNNPYNATGTAPGDPSGLSETHTDTTATITFTNGTAGSNTYNGVQYKIGSGGTWSSSIFTSPFTITGLNASTSYTIYLRSINEDGLTSTGNANIAVTTSASWTDGTVSVTSTGISGTSATTGATLAVSTSGWLAGTTFTYQWYRTRNISGIADLALGTASSQLVSIVGEYYYCAVSYSNTTYNKTGTVYTSSYLVVPAAPAYTLTNNSNSTFTISGVFATGAGYYYGTWGPSSTSISRTAIANSTTITSGAGSISVTLYSSANITYSGDPTVYQINSWESTTKSVSVTSASLMTVTTSTHTNTGGTGTAQTLTSGNTDDGYYQIALPFSITYAGVSYSTVYVGTNGYVTFSAGSTAFSGLSTTNPSGAKIMIAAADRSSNNVTLLSGQFQVSPFYKYFYIKASFGASTTPGSATVWELYASQQNPKELLLNITTNIGTGTYAVTDAADTNYSTLSTAVSKWRITSV